MARTWAVGVGWVLPLYLLRFAPIPLGKMFQFQDPKPVPIIGRSRKTVVEAVITSMVAIGAEDR